MTEFDSWHGFHMIVFLYVASFLIADIQIPLSVVGVMQKLLSSF